MNELPRLCGPVQGPGQDGWRLLSCAAEEQGLDMPAGPPACMFESEPATPSSQAPAKPEEESLSDTLRWMLLVPGEALVAQLAYAGGAWLCGTPCGAGLSVLATEAFEHLLYDEKGVSHARAGGMVMGAGITRGMKPIDGLLVTVLTGAAGFAMSATARFVQDQRQLRADADGELRALKFAFRYESPVMVNQRLNDFSDAQLDGLLGRTSNGVPSLPALGLTEMENESLFNLLDPAQQARMRMRVE